jgi:hypothetical protein
MISTGSPGVRCMMRNTIRVIPIKTGIVCKILLTIYGKVTRKTPLIKLNKAHEECYAFLVGYA